MLYAEQITFTKNKTEAEATRYSFKVRKGVIYRIWITFPTGCHQLVKLRLLIDEHNFLPVHKYAYIRGNGFVFEFPMMFEIKEEPSTITIEGWNEDDTNDHTIDIYVLILDKSLVLPVGATEGILESLSSLIITKETSKEEQQT